MDESKNRQPVASGDKKRNGDADRDQIRQPGSMCGNLTHHPVYPIDVEHCLKAKQAGQMPQPRSQNAESLPTKPTFSYFNSTFASRQSPAVKYIISRSKVIATHINSRYPLPKSLPSGEGLTFTASSEEEWCFANAKLGYLIL